MSNRTSWRFDYQAADLLAACEKIISHSRERLNHWQGRYEKAIREAENKTYKAKVVRQPVTGGERAFIQTDVDREPQAELDLAQQKVDHHTARIEEFDRWRRGFSANSAATFELDPEDIAYFKL